MSSPSCVSNRSLVFAALLLLFSPRWLPAAEVGTARIEKDTVWSDHTVVTGTVNVVAGVTLTVRPGMTVSFARGVESQSGLVIAGRLNALGTAQEPVTFVSPSGEGQAGYLRAEKGASVRLEHCVLRGLGGPRPHEPAFKATEVNGDEQGQGVLVKHCLISGCWGGIALEQVQGAVVEDCEIGDLLGGSCVSMSRCHYGLVRDCRLHSGKSVEGCNGVDLHVTAESEIIGNTITGNWAGVYGMWATGNILERNVIHGNGDGVRWWKSRDNQVVNCTLAHNSHDGIMIIGHGEAYPGNRVKNCLVAFNAHHGVEDAEGSSPPELSHSNVFGNATAAYRNCQAGPQCLSVDPQFVDAKNFDFHLREGSPCLDAGDPLGQDMGAYDQGSQARESAVRRSQLAALMDSGFEEADGKGQPIHWRTGADESGRISIGVDDRVAHGGKRSLRIRIEGPPETDRPVRNCGFNQQIKVLPGKYYLISCWMKAEGARGWPGALIYSEFLGEMQAGPDHTGDYDWKPVSVCVYSKTARTIPVSGYAYISSGTVWFDDLTVAEIDPKELGDWTPRDKSNWEPSAEERQRGYVTFTRPTTERVYHTSLPQKGEVSQELRLWGARQQTVATNLLIHSLDVLADVRLAPGDLRSGKHVLSADKVACRIVEPYRYTLDAYRWVLVPLCLQRREKFTLPANDTAQVYVTVKIPAETAPGRYQGSLALSAAGRTGTQVPIEVEVLPLTLREPGISFFQYYSSSYIPPQYDGRKYQRLYMQNMRDQGFTGITFYNHCEFPDGKGGWTVDVDRKADGDPLSLADSMKLALETGLVNAKTPIVYLSSYAGKEHPEWRHDFGAFLGGSKSVLALEAERKRRGWPEFLYYMIDEPGDEPRNAAARRVHQSTYQNVPVRTVTAIGQPGIDRVGDLYNVWIAAWGDMREDLIRQSREGGKELWTYECWGMGQHPEMARYFAGFWSYRCGVKGNGNWAYISSATGKGGSVYPRLDEQGQYADIDGLSWLFSNVLPGPDGPIDTIGLELRREGIDDFRYCELLDRLIEAKGAAPDAKAKAAVANAQKLRDQIRQRFRPDAFSDMAGGHIWIHDYRPQPELSLSEYDRLRRALAEACVALVESENGDR